MEFWALEHADDMTLIVFTAFIFGFFIVAGFIALYDKITGKKK